MHVREISHGFAAHTISLFQIAFQFLSLNQLQVLSLNVPKCPWMSQNVPKCPKTSQNIPKHRAMSVSLVIIETRPNLILPLRNA